MDVTKSESKGSLFAFFDMGERDDRLKQLGPTSAE
ncbi:MAG: hypothetical protein JWP89_6519 [Schlesneria sp.]|nr:hypothetical protein [Schlesneria sp.]